MKFIIITLVIYLFSAVLCIWLLNRLWARVFDKTGLLVYGMIVFCVGIHIAGGVSWCLALLPPFNDPRNPVVSGIGGGAYGLTYEFYPAAGMTFSAIAILCVLLGFYLLERPTNGSLRGRIDDVRVAIERLPLLLIVNAGLLFAGLYLFVSVYLLGWDTMLGGVATRRELAGSSFLGVVDYRFMVVGGFVVSLPFLVVCVFGDIRSRVWASLVVVMFAFPSLMLGSRRGSFLLICLILCWYLRSRWKLILLLPMLYFVTVVYVHPLAMRSAGVMGLSNFFSVGMGIVSGGLQLRGDISTMLFNLGQGFPVYVEFLDVSASGVQILADAPLLYHILSFSPLPSLFDGFRGGYLHFHSRVNAYTPFSSFAEIGVWGAWASILLVPIFLLVGGRVILLHRRISGLWWWSCVGVAAGFVLMVAHMQQYNVRQSTRFFVYSLDICLVVYILGRFSRHANERKDQRRPLVRPNNARQRS